MLMLLGAGELEDALKIAAGAEPFLSKLKDSDNQYTTKFYRLKGDILFREGVWEDDRNNPSAALSDWERAIETYQIARRKAQGNKLFDSECQNRIGSTQRFMAGRQNEPIIAGNYLTSAEGNFGYSVNMALRADYAHNPQWALVLAEAYNRIGLVHKALGKKSTDPANKKQEYAIARARFAQARQTYKRLLTREPNNKIALVRLILATSNQAIVAEWLGDNPSNQAIAAERIADEIDLLLENRIYFSRRLFEIDPSNPYFADLLSTGLMIQAGHLVAPTGDRSPVLDTQKPVCRKAFMLAKEAVEITRRHLRQDLFEIYRRICLKLSYTEEVTRIDALLGKTVKPKESLPESSQSASLVPAPSRSE